MSAITEELLNSAIQLNQKMDLKNKESICDEIFREQPNLLASVLVLTRMGIPPMYVEVALEALMVMHLALKLSGNKISTITEKEQSEELDRLVATVKFTEGMGPELIKDSISQYVGFKKEPLFLAYAISLLLDHEIFQSEDEKSKFLIMSVLNLVGCFANARRIEKRQVASTPIS